jgi:hypothetical protein
MVDEGVSGNVKVRDRYYGLLVIISVAFLCLAGLVGWFYYHAGIDKGVATCPNASISYNQGYAVGTEYGVNVSIQQMLYYAQNCSVVRINYTGKIYGFVDATCVVRLNQTVN